MRSLRVIAALIALIGTPLLWTNAAPLLGAGWTPDHVSQQDPVPSVMSPYVYNLTVPAIFRITDCCVQGDVYKVFDQAILILTTDDWSAKAPLGGDPWEWTHAGWAKGEVLLGPGFHSLDITGVITGGLPAGFYARIDAVPEPSAVILVGAGLALLGLLRKRVF
jgi:hypothetical protein